MDSQKLSIPKGYFDDTHAEFLSVDTTNHSKRVANLSLLNQGNKMPK